MGAILKVELERPGGNAPVFDLSKVPVGRIFTGNATGYSYLRTSRGAFCLNESRYYENAMFSGFSSYTEQPKGTIATVTSE